MSETKQILDAIIIDFTTEKFNLFFRRKTQKYREINQSYHQFNDKYFSNGTKIGEIKFNDGKLLISTFQAQRNLSEKNGKKAQYEKAKSILKTIENQTYAAGIFIFYDENDNFRFSLIYPESHGAKRQWNHFKRFTYFVSKEFTNKTFLKQIGEKDFSSIDDIKAAFSITAVTTIFYDEFFKIYDRIIRETREINNIKEKTEDEVKIRDFVLLFTIRTIFLGFIQKKKWLGDDEKFIQTFYQEYKRKLAGKNQFYSRWLSRLFFEALNSPQGRKVAYENNEFSKETETKLQMAPFLNGGLFRQKTSYDTNGWLISDKSIEDFFEFLFAHSFTIEENSLEDEDLQLNPEFLGIIFERLVNKANGAVYTPRPEVDLMCRLSLVKWLKKNIESTIRVENLYELFFKESERDDEQKEGSFSQKEAQEILNKLENLAICDPAVGSGAFLVGMMQVLDDVEQSLRTRYNLDGKSLFERKKQIIKQSLYGVEVKEWAVWICQLRLWLSLFVDTPDELKNSFDPILPSLDFKVRQGDSLVQRIGSKAFPISGHNIALSKSVKDKITKLKKLKQQYFDNKSELDVWKLKQQELTIYKEIIDTEINEKITELKNAKYENPAIAQSLFEEEIEEPEQVKIAFNQEIIKKLEDEIKELKEMQQQLGNGSKPLVWSIEFADVFGEKGGFDIVIGNPPYVRQEDIADPAGKVKDKKEYKAHLQEMVKLDFPDYFPPKVKINGQSDLYTYFYIRALRLLNPQGIHTFICSNSWLDVGYGIWLQEFLLDRCPVEMIIDNHAKRSFEAADVNTIISIIHAPQKKVDDNHAVKFVVFKQPFESTIFTENLINIENANEVVTNETYRIYPILNTELKEAGMEYDDENSKNMSLGKYAGNKWGAKYLRCTDFVFELIKTKLKSKGIELRRIAAVESGLYSGINEFFYLSPERVSQTGLPKDYIVPLLKSPQHVKGILLNAESAKFFVFVCNQTKEELKNRSENVYSYIVWGEKQVTKEKGKVKAGVPWPKVETVKNRKPTWYCIPLKKSTNQFMFYGYNDRFIQPYSDKDEYFSDRRLHSIHAFNGIDKLKLAVILNSTLTALFIELQGRVSMGQGALDYATMDAKKTIIFDPNFLNGRLEYPKIFSRSVINNIFIESGLNPILNTPIEEQNPTPLPDRAELDNIVFDALGFSEEERKDVYRAVCRLVWNRISRAKSV